MHETIFHQKQVLQGTIFIMYSYCKYCKRGYFRWGKISRKHWQDISRGGNFHDTTPISFIKAYGFYFRMGVIFAKTKAPKTWKLPPRENFHVYSITNYIYAKFYEVWTIIFKVIAISGHSGVYFRLKYLHAVVTFYTYLLGISSDEMVIMDWNVDILFLQY